MPAFPTCYSLMNSPLRILAIAAAMTTLTSLPRTHAAGTVAPLLTVPVLPLAHWEVQAAAGDKVTLDTRDGCLIAAFETNIDAVHQQGYRSFKRKTFDLLLKQPVKLPPDADRVLFEALGNEMTSGDMPEEAVQLWPLVRDTSGEVLAYIPHRVPTLADGSGHWSRAATANFYSGEAGGATSDIYEASGGDGNSWPDGQLAFLGFRVVVQKPQLGLKSGTIAVSGIEISRGTMPVENPYLYADAILKEPGRYRFYGEVATDFQALPIRGFEQSIDFTPGNLTQERQHLTVPLGHEGDYWFKYGVADTKGNVLKYGDLRFHMGGTVPVPAAPAITPATAPVGNFVRINPGRADGGVYPATGPMDVTLRVFGKGKPKLRVQWRLLQYAYDTPIQSGDEMVQFAAAPFQDVVLKLDGQAGRDAYRLQADVFDGETKIDAQEYVMGRRTDFSRPRESKPGLPVDRALLKRSAYFRATYLQPDNRLKSEDAAYAHFVKTMDDAGSLTRNWTYMIDVAQMEILPGVYDFALLDRILDAAADRGLSLTIRIGHVDQEYLFRWARYSRQHNYDGTEIPENYYGGFALTDQQYLEMWHRLNRALYDRYRNHRAFQGYYLMQPAGEATVQDKPWLGIVAGYEKPAVLAFRHYLQADLGLSLEQLNARWKTRLKSWDEVQPPAPNFKLGKQADLSMPWSDFSNFKIGIDKIWFEQATERIRSYDKEHIIIVYGAPGDPKLTGLVDYFHNGGNHFLQHQGEFVSAWERGRAGWISEPHHPTRWAAYGDQAERGWVLDWTIWVAMSQAGGGGANLHLYYSPERDSLVAHYGDTFAYDRFQKFKPILDELQQVEIHNPPTQVATLQGKLTMATKHRTTFAPRLEDLRRWFELLDVDSIAREDLRAEHAANYRLVLPNLIDEVMSDQDIRQLDNVVRQNGAKLVMTANTGKYCPERGSDAFQLLRQFGIRPPAGAYVENQAGIEARVESDNALFKKGESVPFFTLAQMQQDAQSAEIRNAFWKYPYRWIPQTNYFGYYPGVPAADGEVLARFPDGGAAVSRHKVSQGEVVVFWGTPDFRPAKLGAFMSRAANWAGVKNRRSGNPISLMLEGQSKTGPRRYALLFQDVPGHYTQRLPATTDGQWFVDDMVSDRRIGVFSGQDLREKGLPLDFFQDASPLQILRLTPRDKMEANWIDKPLATAVH